MSNYRTIFREPIVLYCSICNDGDTSWRCPMCIEMQWKLEKEPMPYLEKPLNKSWFETGSEKQVIIQEKIGKLVL